METDIAQKVNEELEARGLDINYDTGNNRVKLWYGLLVEVIYKEDGIISNVGGIPPRIRIAEKTETTLERKADALLHEKTHYDILPLEILPLVYCAIEIGMQFDNTFARFAAMIGSILLYKAILGEFIVEGITSVKYGCNSFTSLNPKPVENS